MNERRSTRLTRLFAAAVLALASQALPSPPVSAHDFSITDVLAVLRSDGSYAVDMTLDVDALALGVAPLTDSADVVRELEAMSPGEFATCVERARDTLLRRVRIRFDGEKQVPWIDFPGLDTPLIAPVDPPSVLGITARLTGRIPEDAREFTFGASRAFGPVQLTVLDATGLEERQQLLEPGEDSASHLLTARQPETAWYPRRVLPAVAIAIVLAGMVWALTRAFRRS